MTQQPTALVIGASRGLGLGLAAEWAARGWRVIATQRNRSEGLGALAARNSAVEIETVDIDNADAVRALKQRLAGRRLEVLFVNAGITRDRMATPATVPNQDFLDVMLTNALSPVRAVELLDDLVPDGGVIAVMSSETASSEKNSGYFQIYSASKVALNMLMKSFAALRPDNKRALLLVCPGWVRTELGGSDAPLTVADSIPQVVDMVEANRGKAGLRYLDRFNNPVPW